MEGIENLKKAFSDPAIIRGPVRRFLERASRTVQVAAKEKAPVDRGRLRSSIATEVRETEAEIGTDLFYAPFVEFGTRPHFPPPSALQPWARRHGFPPGLRGAFLVARKIASRGTPAQPFLLPALNESRGEIDAFLGMMAKEIETDWQEAARG